MTSRRRFLRETAVTVGGTFVVAASGRADACTRSSPVGASTGTASGSQADAARAPVLREIGTVTYDGDARRFRFRYEYALPDSVSELEVQVGSLATSQVSVHEAANLERTDDVTFRWDGGPDPVLTLDRVVESDVYRGNGYVTGDAALAKTIATRLSWRSTGTELAFERSVTFDGAGHAGAGWSYAGPFDSRLRATDPTTYTVVLPAETGDVPVVELLDLFAYGDDRIPTLVGHDEVDVFVVPADRLGESFPAGQTTGSSILLEEPFATVDRVDNLPAHEYVHAQFGDPGRGDMTWLTEGSAEYYGLLLSLNAGLGHIGHFLEAVRTEQYADAVLADVRREDDTRADYRKGAHVLAALDAEIRTRSGGDRTLLAVMTTVDHDVGTYEGFVGAVVDAAGDDAMADWVETYVRTSALPEVPADRRFYVLGDAEPGDIRTVTPTPSPTPSPTARPEGPPDADPADGDGGYTVTTPGFGPVAAGAGLALAALLERIRGR